MTQTTILSRVELESMGPPLAEEIADLGIGEAFLCDLALKHVAMLPEPTTSSVSDRLHLPRALTEEILEKLYREKLIEVRLQTAIGSTRYSMLDRAGTACSDCCRFAAIVGLPPFLLTTTLT